MTKKEKIILEKMSSVLSKKGALRPTNPCNIKAIAINSGKHAESSRLLYRAILEMIYADDPTQGCSLEYAENLVKEALDIVEA